MSSKFDPYHKWLGIPPKDHAPDHYRLLSLEIFEADPEVIESAADRQMAHVRTFQTGKHSELSQKLLNELAVAKLCLLNPSSKAAYDDALRVRSAVSKVAADPSRPTPELLATDAKLPPSQPKPKPVLPLAPALRSPDPIRAWPGLADSETYKLARSMKPTHLDSRPRHKEKVPTRGVFKRFAAVGVTTVIFGALFSLVWHTVNGKGRFARGTPKVPASSSKSPSSPRSSHVPQVTDTAEPTQLSESAREESMQGVLDRQVTPIAPSGALETSPEGPRPDDPSGQTPPQGATESESRPGPGGSMRDEPDLASDLQAPAAPPGVIVNRIVVWNQHNGTENDRSTSSFNVRLFLNNDEVWSRHRIAIEGIANQDTNVALSVPEVHCDRVRVEIEEWRGAGGGLAEVQVFQGSRNVAVGCPAAASAFHDSRFPPSRITDRIVTSSSAPEGYWLLPDGKAGWIEVDLSLPTIEWPSEIAADHIVVWNEHNGPLNQSGTRECNVVLLSMGHEVWRKDRVVLPWEPNVDCSFRLDVPSVTFDRVRIEITKWEGFAGGLSEVEVFSKDRNVALNCPVTSSSSWNRACRPELATDGIRSSRIHESGYWGMAGPGKGWIEIDLTPEQPSCGKAYRSIGEYWCYAQPDCKRGLAWLARCDSPAVRRAAAELDSWDAESGGDLIVRGDSWWDLAITLHGRAKQRFQAQALYNYFRASARVPEAFRAEIQRRIDESLPQLEERHHLFFVWESSKSGIWEDSNNTFRNHVATCSLRPSPFSLWMHPITEPAKSMSAHATFPLRQGYRRVLGAVAIRDGMRARNALTFRILGDGRELWKSRPIQQGGDPVDFDVEIRGISTIELVVDCPGDGYEAHALWLDPHLIE